MRSMFFVCCSSLDILLATDSDGWKQVKDQMDLKLKKTEADGSSKDEPLAFGIGHVQFTSLLQALHAEAVSVLSFA